MRLTDRDRMAIMLKVCEYNEMVDLADNIHMYLSKGSIHIHSFKDNDIVSSLRASELGIDTPLEDELIRIHGFLDAKIREQHEKRMDRFTGAA